MWFGKINPCDDLPTPEKSGRYFPTPEVAPPTTAWREGGGRVPPVKAPPGVLDLMILEHDASSGIGLDRDSFVSTMVGSHADWLSNLIFVDITNKVSN